MREKIVMIRNNVFFFTFLIVSGVCLFCNTQSHAEEYPIIHYKTINTIEATESNKKLYEGYKIYPKTKANPEEIILNRVIFFSEDDKELCHFDHVNLWTIKKNNEQNKYVFYQDLGTYEEGRSILHKGNLFFIDFTKQKTQVLDDDVMSFSVNDDFSLIAYIKNYDTISKREFNLCFYKDNKKSSQIINLDAYFPHDYYSYLGPNLLYRNGRFEILLYEDSTKIGIIVLDTNLNVNFSVKAEYDKETGYNKFVYPTGEVIYDES